MKKRIVSIGFAAGILISICGCSNGSSATESAASTTKAETGNYKIGFSVMDLSNPYFADVLAGAEEYCKEQGIELISNDPHSDTSKQVSAIEDFISAGCDAIVVCALDDSAPQGAVQKAVEAGIPVVVESIYVEGCSGAILINEYDFGYAIGFAAGTWAQEHFPGEKVEFGILDQPTLPTIIDRANGIEQGVLEACPTAVCVAREGAWLTDTGMTKAENFLTSYPDMKMILGINDSGALGAYETVVAKGYGPGEFFVGGCDGTDRALELIEQGTVYQGTVGLDIANREVGIECIELAVRGINGEDISGGYNLTPHAITKETFE